MNVWMELKNLMQYCNWDIFKSIVCLACRACIELSALHQLDFFEHVSLAFCNFENAKSFCDDPHKSVLSDDDGIVTDYRLMCSSVVTLLRFVVRKKVKTRVSKVIVQTVATEVSCFQLI
jgi:hypothetical protein